MLSLHVSHSLVSHSVLETLSIILVTYLHITFPTVKIFLLLPRICVVKLIVCYIFLPLVKTRLLSSFCLSLCGAALWKSSDPQLKTLEVTFTNFLRKIWSLPCHSHTGLLHLTAKLQSIYNIVIFRSAKLLASSSGSSLSLISDLFSESAHCAYTFIGYNSIYGYKHLKAYSQCDRLCGSFIRDALNAPELNRHLEDDIYYISTV